MIDAQSITRALRGKWHRSYGLAFCPAHGNTRTPALSLSNGRDGRLLAHCHAGCAFTDVLDALKGLGLVEGGGTYNPPSADELAALRKAEAAESERKSRHAEACWLEALPIQGTVAEAYLRGRGITCDLPDTLRFHPECWHGPTAKRYPAMIARVDGVDVFAIHRTYLNGIGGKADIPSNKMMLGPCAGGAVRLLVSNGPLVVCEGIETGLSLLSGLLDGPHSVLAALSTSGINGLSLPPRPGKLVIAADGDPPGREAANALARSAHALGWQVSLMTAPEGQDWNDILQGEVAA